MTGGDKARMHPFEIFSEVEKATGIGKERIIGGEKIMQVMRARAQLKAQQAKPN